MLGARPLTSQLPGVSSHTHMHTRKRTHTHRAKAPLRPCHTHTRAFMYESGRMCVCVKGRKQEVELKGKEADQRQEDDVRGWMEEMENCRKGGGGVVRKEMEYGMGEN